MVNRLYRATNSKIAMVQHIVEIGYFDVVRRGCYMHI